MNEQNEVAGTVVNDSGEQVLDLRPINLNTLDANDPRLIPTNNQISTYFAEGYTLSSFRTRNRDAAKDEAKRVRQTEGKRTAYITLLGGWFSILEADPKPTQAQEAAAKPKRAIVPVAVQTPAGETMNFDSTTAARAFARLIIEAARQAEWEYDLAQVGLAKSEEESAAD